jgi:hypothetical protein
MSCFDFHIGTPYPVSYTEVLDSNDTRFGGCGTMGPDTVYEDECPLNRMSLRRVWNLPRVFLRHPAVILLAGDIESNPQALRTHCVTEVSLWRNISCLYSVISSIHQ